MLTMVVKKSQYHQLKPKKGVDYENDYTITWPNGTESQGFTDSAGIDREEHAPFD